MKKQIKFQTLQRFDLGDANDLQGLVDEQLTLQNYGLKGGDLAETAVGGMILSPFSCASVGAGNSSATAWITLNPFKFMLPNGEVIEHTNSALQISYSTLRSAAISANAARTGVLWGNYNDVDTDNESRNFWDPLSEAEIAQNIDTRTVKTPTFVITTTSGQPAAIGGRKWINLATVSCTSSGGTFKVVNIDAVRQYNEMAGMLYYKPLEVTSSTRSQRFGLGTYWNNIEEMFYKIITSGSADDSAKTALNRGANPQYSLQGLKREIDKTENIGVVASILFRIVANPDFTTVGSPTPADPEFYAYKREDVEIVAQTRCNSIPTRTRFDGSESGNPTVVTAFSKFRNGVFEVVLASDATDATTFGQGQTISTAANDSAYNTQKVQLKAWIAPSWITGTDATVDAGPDANEVDLVYNTQFHFDPNAMFRIVGPVWEIDDIGTDKNQIGGLYTTSNNIDSRTRAVFINFDGWNYFNNTARINVLNRYWNNVSSTLGQGLENTLDTSIDLAGAGALKVTPPDIFLQVDIYGDLRLVK
jgi:hypothetical protein